ncbi:GWT1-domain-containing protein [Fimicolochytrium jonesii]|uniref:GWT1-domain-containing protein n=1 Tax=Fimicolochytrium jonesii TaxID=1396493 RepID=UPI0022FE610F|nr:GWT1-domain-containing protein [Fimicolochytrium jonesii]KAI8816064.1 GWT1-domain-containing protein [Fimicolochytrium jonesii]
MDDERRAAKEGHVRGHTGSTLTEVQAIVSFTTVCYALWKGVVKHYPGLAKPSLAGYIFELGILFLAFVLAVTTEWLWEMLVGMAVTAAVLALLPARATRKKEAAVEKPAGQRLYIPFLTASRALLQMTTVVSILAVDFHAFPRRHAKTETFGASMMDAGIGMFLYIAGISAARPSITSGGGRGSYWTYLRRSLKSSGLIFFIGLIRVISTKSVNYQEHVEEYGVHWNFYVTLGLIPLFFALLGASSSGTYLTAVATILVIAYQTLLERTTLQSYILHAPRTDLLSMNREGVFSLIGSFAVFLYAAAFGLRMKSRFQQQGVASLHGTFVYQLIGTVVFYAVTLFFTEERHVAISRRMVNLPYVTWIVALTTSQLMGVLLADLVFGTHHTPNTLKAINRNPFTFFLVGNLLTGAINLSLDTLSYGPTAARAIVSAYVMVVTGIIIVLDRLRITIK